MAWDDDVNWDVGDPGQPDFTPIPENPPPLISGGLTVGPDINSPDPLVGGDSDWATILGKILGGGAGAISSGGGSSLISRLGTMLGGGSGGSGISDFLMLLSLLGGGALGVNAGNTAKQGGQEIKAAADKSNEQATGLFDKAQANYAPYQAAGVNALAGLQTPVNLASQFNAAGTPSALGNKFSGAMTLSQLAKR